MKAVLPRRSYEMRARNEPLCRSFCRDDGYLETEVPELMSCEGRPRGERLLARKTIFREGQQIDKADSSSPVLISSSHRVLVTYPELRYFKTHDR